MYYQHCNQHTKIHSYIELHLQGKTLCLKLEICTLSEWSRILTQCHVKLFLRLLWAYILTRFDPFSIDLRSYPFFTSNVSTRTIFVDACCTIISININKCSKVNFTLNRVYKLETSCILYTLFTVQFTLLYLLIFNVHPLVLLSLIWQVSVL